MGRNIASQLFFVLVAVGMIFTAAGCDRKKEGAEVRKVHVANTNYYIPYDFVDEQGNSTGFEVEVLREVDALLPEYEFVFHPVSDDELLIGVQTGKYQIGTKGVWFTEERKLKYVFPTEPIAASVIGITYRKADSQTIYDLESFARSKGKLVPIAPQSAQYSIVVEFNERNPDCPIELVPSESFVISDAYSWVLEGRYDAFFDIKLSYQNNIVNVDAPYHQWHESLAYAPYKGIPTWPLFNKEEQQLADAYDRAIKILKENGVLAELSLQWFGEDVFSYITD